MATKVISVLVKGWSDVGSELRFPCRKRGINASLRQSCSHFLVIWPALNLHPGKPRHVSRRIASTSRHCALLFVVTATYANNCPDIRSVLFNCDQIRVRRRHPEMIGCHWRLLTTIFRPVTGAGGHKHKAASCQKGSESHYDIRVGVKCIRWEWRFNDKVRSPAATSRHRRRLANSTRSGRPPTIIFDWDATL